MVMIIFSFQSKSYKTQVRNGVPKPHIFASAHKIQHTNKITIRYMVGYISLYSKLSKQRLA